MCELLRNPAFYSALAAAASALTAILALTVLRKNYRLASAKSRSFFQAEVNKIYKQSETLLLNQISFPFEMIFKNIGENSAHSISIKMLVYDPEESVQPVLKNRMILLKIYRKIKRSAMQ